MGGHARTILAGKSGDQPVDTGFIVFNYATYPNLTRLFSDLDVPVTKSDMSFGASIDDGRIEYALRNLRGLTAQRRNLLRPQFYGMISDILRFGRMAAEAASDDGKTIGELVDELALGKWFRDYYLMPFCGAIWSTPAGEIDQFPARSLVRFFQNHALLTRGWQHQWWTVKGGSIEYVRRLEDALHNRGCAIRKQCPVVGLERTPEGVALQIANAPRQHFDDVILACHSDQALKILGGNATAIERQALGGIRYQSNRAVLHRDPLQMPKRRSCWSSWSYRSEGGAAGVTYWMNRLQSIPDSDPLFLSLNPTREISEKLVYDSTDFMHPVFDSRALKSQETLTRIQGHNRTWFAGAYNRHGFHEDGIASAMRVIRIMNRTRLTEENWHVSDRSDFEVDSPFELRATA